MRSLRKKPFYLVLACSLAATLTFTLPFLFGRELSQEKFDRLVESDRTAFSKRFAKEIWPLLKRRGKDGCVGCHVPKHRSSLRFQGNPDSDFRKMLRDGFFLPDDTGSLAHVVGTKIKRDQMPPGDRQRWNRKEIEILQQFVRDLDKKQKR